MKKFNEWRADVDQYENPDILVEKITNLIHQLEVELDAFQGERFEGFLHLIGGVRNLQKTLAEIEHNCVGDTPQYATEAANGKPAAPRKMKKLPDHQVKSSGVRKGQDDLSSDYKGHIKMNGEVEPFQVMKKK